MSETLLIVALFLFGQLGDRYDTSTETSVLTEENTEPATTAPADQSAQDSPASAGSPAEANPFAASAEDSQEQAEPLVREQSPPPETRHMESDSTTQLSTDGDPEELLKSFHQQPANSQLAGSPISLADVVVSNSTRSAQTAGVEAYWDLSQAVLDYHLALKEKVELEALRSGMANSGTHWDEQIRHASDQVELARQAAYLAQQRTARSLGITSEEKLPLPSDLPFVGTYNTRFAELFAKPTDSLPNETLNAAKAYHEFLTNAAQVIENEAEAISTAREWMFMKSEQRAPDSDGRELLSAYELFAARRRLFLATVAEYNRTIVRYTEIATPGPLEPQRLVAMLIRVDEDTANVIDSAIRRASAEEQLGTSQQNPAEPRTTAENSWRALPNNSERSILVPSR